MIADGYEIRALRLGDAPALAAAYSRNREHLAPWEPVRSPEFFTAAGQESAIAGQLTAVERGISTMWVLVHRDLVVGRLNFNTIVRGVMQGATLGYWVDAEHQGRGLATAMVRFACAEGLRMGLHRIEASTLPHNEPSQRVLERCGFTRFGMAPDFLFLAGKWQDSVLFQRVLHDDPL